MHILGGLQYSLPEYYCGFLGPLRDHKGSLYIIEDCGTVFRDIVSGLFRAVRYFVFVQTVSGLGCEIHILGVLQYSLPEYYCGFSVKSMSMLCVISCFAIFLHMACVWIQDRFIHLIAIWRHFLFEFVPLMYVVSVTISRRAQVRVSTVPSEYFLLCHGPCRSFGMFGDVDCCLLLHMACVWTIS